MINNFKKVDTRNKIKELVNFTKKSIDNYKPQFSSEEVNQKIDLNNRLLKREIEGYVKHEFSPVKPILKGEQKDGKYIQYFECPVCGRKMYCEFDNYCKDCGAEFDWSK